MNEAFADFAESSYSWRFIERPAFDRALPNRVYNPNVKVLDIGSGPGRVVNYHIQRGASEENVSGVDPENTSILMAMRRFPSAQFIKEKVQDTQLPTSQDIITAQLTLRYLDNDELSRTMGRVAAALAPGGLFFMLDVHPDRYAIKDGFCRYFQEGWRTVDLPWGGTEDYYYRTIGSYAILLRRAGLDIVSIDPCPLHPAGLSEENVGEYASYSASLARFAITAVKPATR